MKAIHWMFGPSLVVACVLGFGIPNTLLASSDDANAQQAADTRVAKIGDPQRYLSQIHAKVEEAKSGKKGKLKMSDVRRLDSAERRIELLVAGKSALSDLDAEQRVEVYNAQETIDGIVASNSAGRLVCSHVQVSGTRLKTTRCLSRADSEARARASREALRDQQRSEWQGPAR